MSDPTPTPALPLDFPPLLAFAEEMAREFHQSMVLANRDNSGPPMLAWDLLPAHLRRLDVQAHARLLADLTRPASRDFWARWLAGRVGLVCGATAPTFARMLGVGPRPAWRLMVHGDTDYDRSPATEVLTHGFAEPGDFPDAPAGLLHAVPGISSITDPSAALLTAILATEPRHV